MDYPKFLSLITSNALYFAKPNEFEDKLDSVFPEYLGYKNDEKFISIVKEECDIIARKILRKFAYSDLYESQIYKFYHSKTLIKILGDHKKYTILKFLSIQLAFLIISIPVQLSCFYNFYFHSGYIIFMIILLGYNSARIKEEKIKGIIKNV